jgi:ferritin-like metal-binding protein YciE
MKLESLSDVFEAELKDLYSAEQQLVDALPTIANAASSPELKQAIESHLKETQGHVKRLEQVFDTVGIPAESEHCDGMEGLLSEGSEVAKASGNGEARDAALIGAAQRVEHYEIAAYGTARQLADDIGLGEIRDLMDQTLDEESQADKLLTKLATGGMFKSGLNQQAV